LAGMCPRCRHTTGSVSDGDTVDSGHVQLLPPVASLVQQMEMVETVKEARSGGTKIGREKVRGRRW